MTYHINPTVSKIRSPIMVCIDSHREDKDYDIYYFNDGIDLSKHNWSKPYLIEYIDISQDDENNMYIFIRLIENKQINSTNWIGEEQVSFF